MNQYNSIDPYGTYDVKGLSPYEMAMKMASWNQSLRSTLVKTNEDLSNVESVIVQHAEAIGLRVLKENYTGEIVASMIALDPYSVTIIANSLNLSGYVTFTDLSQSGRTTINGGNIMTNTITSDHILVGQLSAISSNLGSINAGYIYGVTIEAATISGAAINGGNINVANDVYIGNNLIMGQYNSGVQKTIKFNDRARIVGGGGSFDGNMSISSDVLTLNPSSININTGSVNFNNATITGLTVPYAASAGNANTLQGYAASSFSLNGHVHSDSQYVKPYTSQSIKLWISGNKLRVYLGSSYQEFTATGSG